jgi:hypothetical protein
LLTTVSAGVALVGPQSIRQPQAAQSQIVIRSVHASEKPGAKITIMVKETFISDGIDGMTVGEPPHYGVVVREVGGKMAPYTELGQKMNEGPVEVTTDILFDVKAGTTWNNKIIASEMYDMSRPGKYLIQVVRRSVKSNTITLTVIP